jgi:putative transcriptional regulator
MPMLRRLLLILCLAACGGAGAAESTSDAISGHFLVASADMGDPRFAETVIYVVEHGEEGAMGLVINRVIGRGPVAALMKAVGMDPGKADGEISLGYGGPVQPSLGLVLHGEEFDTGNSQKIGNGLALSGQVDMLKSMAAGRKPDQSRFVLGYAGWGPSQLEREIAEGDWTVVPFDRALLFDEETDKVWEKAKARTETEL